MTETLSYVQGDPAVVSSTAATLAETAEVLLAAAADLLDLTNRNETISIAVDAVRSLATQVHGEIVLAEQRYATTAEALAEYAPLFADGKQRADTAVDAYYPQAAAVTEAYNDFYYYSGEPDGEDEARQDWLDADARARGTLEDYEAAIADIRSASNTAASKIAVVVDQSDLNDSFWQNVGGFFSGVGDWFADVFGPILAGLLDILGRALQILCLLSALVLVITLLPILLVGGLVAMTTGWDWALDATIGVLLYAISPMILAAWITGQGTPTVTPYGTVQGPRERVRGEDDDTPFADTLTDQDVIDGAGAAGVLGDDSGVIQVTVVVGEDGVTRYRVQIPSTQQWFSAGGSAPNDLDGNLWSKLLPSERSALEKAVAQALLDAGYIPGSGSDVMLSGFSQGGIVAANLAADPDFTRRFDVTSVVTSGSPIGDVAVPDRVTVISQEHHADPVPHLDFFTDNPTGPNWHLVTGPGDHMASQYHDTAVEGIDGTTDPGLRDAVDSLDGFFYGTETIHQFEVRR